MKPAYVTIPYFGGEWNVRFYKEGNKTCWHSGYGNIPEEYKGIPVIDFTGCSDQALLKFLKMNLYPVECYIRGNCTLEEYFKVAEKLGIKVKREGL